ncbi:efflux RND transporter periplasmic adaptor subunit [Terrihabitans soli]|uniref:efflux RND transporter periplasmic adaptor subunit n=1 Tax=Terrihabitans soli TaxID=708113 RepID=UPI001CEC2574|nr:efflux RND transporter periplasmic adaptor subunit [Terrihabitans soli]
MRARLALLFAFAALTFVLPAAAQEKAPAASNVSTVAAEKRAISQSAQFVGRVEAVERVDIRARVTGFLEEVLFKDGETVKKGAPLYRIEQAPFQAAVQQAEANVQRAQATVDNAVVQRQRAEQLLLTNATSVAARDDKVAAQKTAEGDLAAATAALETAKISLAYTDIASPIDGQIGRTAVTRGNVVGPDSGVLTTIVSSDPMYVVFPVSQREFLRLAERHGQKENRENFKVFITFSNGRRYAQAGTIDFVDVKVDRGTDTIPVRASFANSGGELVDGQLVQVDVETSAAEEHVLIPQNALIADQEGVYVFIVEEGKVAQRRLKVGQPSGASIVVTEGLSGGEPVIVGGLQSLRPGTPVTAVPIEKPVGG